MWQSRKNAPARERVGATTRRLLNQEKKSSTNLLRPSDIPIGYVLIRGNFNTEKR